MQNAAASSASRSAYPNAWSLMKFGCALRRRLAIGMAPRLHAPRLYVSVSRLRSWPPCWRGLSTGGGSSGSGTNRIRWAARQAESSQLPPGVGASHLQPAAAAFQSALETPSPLLDGARSLLNTVRAMREAGPDRRTSVLFSEGEPDRLRVAVRACRIGNGNYFDEIVLKQKSARVPPGLPDHRDEGSRLSPPPSGIVVIGDSLKRGIRPANAAGCTTVYCPGDLWGREDPEGTGRASQLCRRTGR